MPKKQPLPKIIAIIGPTASGKSSLAVYLAKKMGGEIVSADSRQVYRGLNIGTEKITKLEMQGVPHHLLDIVSPRRAFSVAQYKKYAERVIDDILERGKVPLLVGGSGFYIEAIVDNRTAPLVPPNQALRKKLEQESAETLFSALSKLDPKRAGAIDPHNKRRLIRAIEIAQTLGKVPPTPPSQPKYDVLQIGLKPDKKFEEQLEERLLRAIRKGLLREVKMVRESGISWKRISELGLEYRTAGEYIRGKLTRDEMVEKMKRELRNYAKRQMRWFKRDKRIKWFDPKKKRGIEHSVKNFLKM